MVMSSFDGEEQFPDVLSRLTNTSDKMTSTQRITAAVIEVCLGRPAQETKNDTPELTQCDFTELFNNNSDLNHFYNVTYYNDLNTPNALKRFVKRLIRKLCAPIMRPIVDTQRTFNISVTRSINCILHNSSHINTLILEHQQLVHKIDVCQKKLNTLLEAKNGNRLPPK